MKQKERDYVPGMTASIQGESGPMDGELVVVSWTPFKGTAVDLAAIQPESRIVFPIAAINEL